MGMVVWQGLSELDGITPIVLIATDRSENRKTGGMIQTWILRADMAPHDALREGNDEAICGTCPHRGVASGGSGACYVTVFQAPLSTYRAWERGNATAYSLDMFRGRKVRFGAYGDPAAVPLHVWESIAGVASAVTGYTHQWASCSTDYAQWCMASCDSIDEYREARRAGYRSFVVRAMGSPKPDGVVACPASAEAGKRATCADCLQCGGTSNGRKADITIEAHGPTARAFKPSIQGERILV